MTNVHPLPFGAETPDELLVAYANGSLSPAERAEVDRWLAAHPEWVARLRAYQAVGTAVRQAAGSSRPPAIGSLAGLWAAVDATAQPQPQRPATPPPPYVTAPPGRGGSGSPKWLLAVAASVVVAVGAASVVLARNRDGGELTIRDDRAETEAAPAATDTTVAADDGEVTGAAPAPGSGSDAAQALRDGAESTSEQDTAHTTFNAIALVDLTGTDIADLANTDAVTVTITGTGQVQFPDDSVLDTTSTFSGGLFDAFPEEVVSTVTKGKDTYVSCEGSPYVLETDDTDGECSSLSLGTAFFGPDAGLSLLDRANDGVTELGVEDIDGAPATHYQLEVDLADEGDPPEPALFDVWIGVDDGLIHQLTVTLDTILPLEFNGTTDELPIALEMTYQLGQFGEPVAIPEVG